MSSLKIKDIRELYRKGKDGTPVKTLCEEFGVGELYVRDIMDGRMYADITGADGSNGHCY